MQIAQELSASLAVKPDNSCAICITCSW
jgi:hypothetical protein